MTVLGTASGVVGVAQGESALDAAGHRYFFLGSDATGASFVYVMDTQTGQEIAALPAGFSGGLQYDPGSGDLLGLRFHSTGGGPIAQGYEEFCTEDPTTGNVTVICTAPSVVGVAQGESALDAAGHRYFFVGFDGTGTSFVYVMDTQTGQEIAALPTVVSAGFSSSLRFGPEQDGTPSAGLEGVSLTLDYQQLDANGDVISDLGAAAPTSAGSYQVTASFAGSTDYGAASASTTFTIALPATTTTVSSSLNPSVFNQSVKFTATVTNASGAAAPTGSVEFFDGSIDLGAGSALHRAGAGYTSTISIKSLPAGVDNVVAVYTATGDFASSSGSVAQTVTPATPKISVKDAGGVYNGTAYAATATVAGVVAGVDNSPSPTLEGVGLTLEYVQINADGSKTDLGSTAPTGDGSYTATAAFAGSADYAAGSKTVAFTIRQAAPKLAVTDASGAYNGLPYAATATVAGVVVGVDNIPSPRWKAWA